MELISNWTNRGARYKIKYTDDIVRVLTAVRNDKLLNLKEATQKGIDSLLSSLQSRSDSIITK